MFSTSPSLIERLQQPNDPNARARFVQLYSPLMLHWSRRPGVPVQEAGDLVQTVLVRLLQGIGRFVRREAGSFRAWLYTALTTAWRDSMNRPHR